MVQHNQNANGPLRACNLSPPRQQNQDKKGSIPYEDDFYLKTEHYCENTSELSLESIITTTLDNRNPVLCPDKDLIFLL